MTSPRPLRPLPHRLPPRRRRPHRPVQLALRPEHRRHLRPAHRGHRQGAEHRRAHPGDPRRARLARHHLGRGAVLPGRLRRPAPGRRRAAAGARARPTAASAPGRSSTRSGPRAEKAGGGFRYDGRCGRLTPGGDRGAAGRAGIPFSIRFRMPDEEIAWDDAVHGRISFQGHDLDDFVILRSDGTPIYNLAVVSRRHRHADHPRDPGRRPHLQHPEADRALPRARAQPTRSSPTCR